MTISKVEPDLRQIIQNLRDGNMEKASDYEDPDRCVQILRECGHVPTGAVGTVNFLKMPEGMSAQVFEREEVLADR